MSQNATFLTALKAAGPNGVHSHYAHVHLRINDPSARMRDLRAQGFDVRSESAPRGGRNGALYRYFGKIGAAHTGSSPWSPRASSNGRNLSRPSEPAGVSPPSLGDASAPLTKVLDLTDPERPRVRWEEPAQENAPASRPSRAEHRGVAA